VNVCEAPTPSVDAIIVGLLCNAPASVAATLKVLVVTLVEMDVLLKYKHLHHVLMQH
jgi:hypothetical protein